MIRQALRYRAQEAINNMSAGDWPTEPLAYIKGMFEGCVYTSRETYTDISDLYAEIERMAWQMDFGHRPESAALDPIAQLFDLTR